jgi:ribonuclease E
MANKMLIDATHPEETRVVVLRGNRVEEFDFESANRRQLRGNIYLAKVTRVEPSLQAAFVDYGGNRHGFLAFSEIHPDYYQIPVADRQALIEEEERAHRAAEAEHERRSGMRRRRHAAAGRSVETIASEPTDAEVVENGGANGAGAAGDADTEARPAAVSDVHDHSGQDHSRDHTDHLEHDSSNDRIAGSTAGERVHAAGDWTSDAEGFAEQHGALQAEAAQDDAMPLSDHGRGAQVADAAEEVESPTLARGEAPPLVDEPPGAIPRRSRSAPLSRRGDFAGYGSAQDAEAEEPAEDVETSKFEAADTEPEDAETGDAETDDTERDRGDGAESGEEEEEEEIVESVGGADVLEEVPDRSPRYRRAYKIQEVIKRRQIMLVQVVKEERGTKGAALTTYLSLAGRYSVLMPNTARGGGISRKITSVQDRKRLKEVAQELDVPDGMGVILRTAGASRTKTEIKRDFEYLLRAWETVRDLTLRSTAPTLVYEEGSLVKRSIRDLYNKDIDEVIVAGDESYREARDFMRMLMPTHAKNVKPYLENQPILTRYGIESQLDAMFSPVVQLRSGGYIVLNQAEALVAIDVNSGRATREHHIEDTALKTNLEASEEIARQLRLRDLAGLIVIDFIDMDEKRNNRSVERRLKDCLKNDRARIQVGRISHFGLLEMSRQRIRTSVLESSTDKCPHCGGTGHVRSVASVALQCLRMIEEQLQRGATHNVVLRTRSEIALYVLNQKRGHLHDLEQRFQIAIMVSVDPTISGQLPFLIEKGEQVHSLDQARALAAQATSIPIADHDADEIDQTDTVEEDEAEITDADLAEAGESAEAAERVADGNGEGGRRRRRRRRRGRPVRDGDFQEVGVRHGIGENEQPAGSQHDPDGQQADHRPLDHEQLNNEHVDHQGEPELSIPSDESPLSGEAAGDGGNVPQGVSLADQVDRDTDQDASERPSPAAAADESQEDSAGRRRRRGRRGGRKGRRDETVPLPELEAAPIEEELVHAVADFGGPIFDRRDEHASVSHEPAGDIKAEIEPGPPAGLPPMDRSDLPRTEPPGLDAPRADAPKSELPVSERARRRSTVREPVRLLDSAAPMAASAPTPVPPVEPPVSTGRGAGTDAAAAAPRRAGWWAKRLFGENK